MKGEVVHTIAYKEATQCPAASIPTEGAANPEKYQSGLGDVPGARERVGLERKTRAAEPLPSIRSLSAQDNTFIQRRAWVANEVMCKGTLRIDVTYWGGGNCNRCEKSVEDEFDRNGELKSARIQRYWQYVGLAGRTALRQFQ
jgi:hypothetical protein